MEAPLGVTTLGESPENSTRLQVGSRQMLILSSVAESLTQPSKVLIRIMLSRNNIRIKVLQTLYAFLQTAEKDTAVAERNY